jgi:CubicO group peptidase (beta-lactamase class C family)
MLVSVAREGFTPAQAEKLAPQFYDVSVAVSGGDAALFGLLNYSELNKTTVIARTGSVMELELVENPAIGNVRFQTDLGDKNLDEYLADPRSRVQGFIVVHRGRIVYEQYPGMRPNDYHMWMSTTKTAASLMVRLLEEDGLIDVNRSVTDYLSWLEGTGWEEVKVIDALDMKSGLNILEDRATRIDPGSIANRMLLANGGLPYNGVVEKLSDVITSAQRVIPPGQAYEYSSINTLLLVYLAEAVTGHRWKDLFHERVWSKMGVEGDMVMGVNSQGLALAHGEANTRLRDLARFGMLYTPSWNKVARERIVSESYVRQLSAGGDPVAFRNGQADTKYGEMFGDTTVTSNHYQWDVIFADGDFHKNGMQGQGLYVSPSKDLVVAFFSTKAVYQVPGYARAIAKSLN